MTDARRAPTCDEMRLAAEIRARLGPADRSNAIPLSDAENRAVIGQLIRDLSAFARPFRTSREMRQAAERAAQADADA